MSIPSSSDPTVRMQSSFPPDSPPRAAVGESSHFHSPEGRGIQTALARIASSQQRASSNLKRTASALDEDKKMKTGVCTLNFSQSEELAPTIAPRLAPQAQTANAIGLKRLSSSQETDEDNVDVKIMRSDIFMPSDGRVTPLAANSFLLPEFTKVPLAARTSLQPPPTPQKRRIRAQKEPSRFQIIFRSTEQGEIVIRGQTVVVIPLSDKGSYMNVFTPGASSPLVKDISNSALVIKTFNRQRSKEPENRLKMFMTTALQSYRNAQMLGVPVAAIYNEATALQDGYYIQEKVAHPLDILNVSHVQQARHFFINFLDNKHILFDLLPDNLRVTEDGRVKLIDFVEEDDDPWGVLFKHALTYWCKLYSKTTGANLDGTSVFLQEFTASFERHGYDLSWNPEIIENCFR